MVEALETSHNQDQNILYNEIESLSDKDKKDLDIALMRLFSKTKYAEGNQQRQLGLATVIEKGASGVSYITDRFLSAQLDSTEEFAKIVNATTIEWNLPLVLNILANRKINDASENDYKAARIISRSLTRMMTEVENDLFSVDAHTHLPEYTQAIITFLKSQPQLNAETVFNCRTALAYARTPDALAFLASYTPHRDYIPYEQIANYPNNWIRGWDFESTTNLEDIAQRKDYKNIAGEVSLTYNNFSSMPLPNQFAGISGETIITNLDWFVNDTGERSGSKILPGSRCLFIDFIPEGMQEKPTDKGAILENIAMSAKDLLQLINLLKTQEPFNHAEWVIGTTNKQMALFAMKHAGFERLRSDSDPRSIRERNEEEKQLEIEAEKKGEKAVVPIDIAVSREALLAKEDELRITQKSYEERIRGINERIIRTREES